MVMQQLSTPLEPWLRIPSKESLQHEVQLSTGATLPVAETLEPAISASTKTKVAQGQGKRGGGFTLTSRMCGL